MCQTTCFGSPDEGGRCRVRIGVVEVGSNLLEETDSHLIGDGVAGAGGSVAGARTFWVAARRAGERFGGMRK